MIKKKLTSIIYDGIFINVADGGRKKLLKTSKKQLTSINDIDIILFVADEAHEKFCSLKTKQSRKTSTLVLVTICNKKQLF